MVGGCKHGRKAWECEDCDPQLKIDRLTALLRDLACSGVGFNDERLGFIDVQVDRDVWERLMEWRARDEGGA